MKLSAPAPAPIRNLPRIEEFHAYAKALSGGETPGLVLDDGAVRRVVARSGQPAPGTQPNLTFSRLDLGAAAFNALGQVGFSGWVSGPDLTGNETYGLWLETTPGNLDAIVRGGDPAPGGGRFRLDRQQPFALNAVGQIALEPSLPTMAEGAFGPPTDRAS